MKAKIHLNFKLKLLSLSLIEISLFCFKIENDHLVNFTLLVKACFISDDIYFCIRLVERIISVVPAKVYIAYI